MRIYFLNGRLPEPHPGYHQKLKKHRKGVRHEIEIVFYRFTVPEELYNRVSYPLALTNSGAKKALAKAFYDYMGSLEAIRV
ncbi:MAG: hypothetical protein GY737_21935 [Desulfobacteraceae bacterium]|nr:hypothetical protein [Desulfobacteraceae bacterium]